MASSRVVFPLIVLSDDKQAAQHLEQSTINLNIVLLHGVMGEVGVFVEG
jgi:hypothetical protein